MLAAPNLLKLLIIILPSAVAATLIPAIDPRIRVVGRTVTENTTLLFDWSSVYIEANVTRGPLSILLAEGWSHGNEYFVSVNGTPWAWKIFIDCVPGLVRV